MKKFLYTGLLAAATLLLTGCPVHQWPECKWSLPTRIHLHYQPDFWLWEHYYDPHTGEVLEIYPETGVDPDHPGTSDRYTCVCDEALMRYVVRVYAPDTWSIQTREAIFQRNTEGGYDCDVELELPDGEYNIAAWSDLLENENDTPYHDATDFESVKLLCDNYRACTDLRDAYRGLAHATIETVVTRDPNAEEPEAVVVEMHRPMAKFEFVTTDLSEFLDRETSRRQLSVRARADEYVVQFSYGSYLPAAYSVIGDLLGDSETGVQFRSELTVTGESEASMGFDYVMINDIPRAEVEVRVTVFDLEGVQVAQSAPILVPLRRDHHTLLHGAFLTLDARGGVTVDPDYDGDHNIIF